MSLVDAKHIVDVWSVIVSWNPNEEKRKYIINNQKIHGCIGHGHEMSS